jgi:hypothetical protein
MKRLDIIISQSIDDDFMMACEAKKVGQMFTKVPQVLGKGFSVPKMGDNVWPQINTMYCIFCSDEEANAVIDILKELREKYLGEGIACFVSEGVETAF